MRLTGTAAMITGSSRGLGRAVALRYAREGARVSLCSRTPKEIEAVAQEIRRAGGEAIGLKADVSQERDVDRLTAMTLKAFGRLDVLVNNAGVLTPRAPIHQVKVTDWDATLAVNLRGAFLCCREVVPHMQARGSGKIINMCSQLGYTGRARYTGYAAAKGGLLTFTRALAQELAPAIQVNAVAPGLVDTGFDPLPESRKREIAESLPLKRLGRPEDVAPVFVFLASDDARYFCGQTLGPNGGEVMP